MRSDEDILNKRLGDAFDEDSSIKENKIVVEFTMQHFGLNLPYYWVFEKLEVELDTLVYKADVSISKLVSVGVLFSLVFVMMFYAGPLKWGVFINVIFMVMAYFRLHSKVKKELALYEEIKQKRPLT